MAAAAENSETDLGKVSQRGSEGRRRRKKGAAELITKAALAFGKKKSERTIMAAHLYYF